MPYQNNLKPYDETLPQTAACIELMSILVDNIAYQHANTPYYLTLFCSSRLPDVSINDYLLRCSLVMQLDEPYFIVMMLYLDRYFSRVRTDILHGLNAHRLLFSCLRLAHKYLDDIPLPPVLYKVAAGVPSDELNNLEAELLSCLNFHLYFTEEDYLITKLSLANYARELESTSQKKYCFSLTPEEERTWQQLFLQRQARQASVTASEAQAAAAPANLPVKKDVVSLQPVSTEPAVTEPLDLAKQASVTDSEKALEAKESTFDSNRKASHEQATAIAASSQYAFFSAAEQGQQADEDRMRLSP